MRATPRGVHFRPPQATRKGWPYYRRPLHQRHDRFVYSRATPCGWPAWRSHGLQLPLLGPALAGGLRGAGTSFSERLWGYPLRVPGSVGAGYPVLADIPRWWASRVPCRDYRYPACGIETKLPAHEEGYSATSICWRKLHFEWFRGLGSRIGEELVAEVSSRWRFHARIRHQGAAAVSVARGAAPDQRLPVGAIALAVLAMSVAEQWLELVQYGAGHAARIGLVDQLFDFVGHQFVAFDQRLGHSDHRLAVFLKEPLDLFHLLLQQIFHAVDQVRYADARILAGQGGVGDEGAIHAVHADEARRLFCSLGKIGGDAIQLDIQEQFLCRARGQADLDARQHLFFAARLHRLFLAPGSKSLGAAQTIVAVQCDIGGEVAIHQVIASDRVSCLVVGQAAALDGRQVAELAQPELVRILCCDQVFVCDHIAPIEVGNDDGLVDDMLDGNRGIVEHALHEGLNGDIRVVLDFVQVILDNLTAIFIGWRQHADLAIKATGAQQCRVKRIGNVGSADGEDRFGLGAGMVEAERAQDFLEPASFYGWRVHLHQ